MATFNLDSFTAALNESNKQNSGVDFSGKSLKLNSEVDARQIVDAINQCPSLQYLTLTGNTLGVEAAQAIAKALERHPEFKLAQWSDMFTGRMKTEIPPALSALGDGMIVAGARLTVLDLSDNAFGPIGVEGLARLLQSEVCSELQVLRLNNNGLGITGGKLLARALTTGRPPRLRTFIAGRNRLENEGAKALAEVFKRMGSLEEIAMPQNGIYHVGVTALSDAFKHNPALRTLNLNDNTIGPKGALAIAAALPSLKSLKDINFGDCLLKSKGALALAKGFKDNSMQLEALNLSHNEIGRDACMEVVRCVTAQLCGAALQRVVLAGNSLGGAEAKREMRARLGDAGELSEGEGSDEEYVTGSEDSSSEGEGEGEGEEGGEDSATEDSQHGQLSAADDATLDTSGAVEEVDSPAARFLQQPTAEHLRALGDDPVTAIDSHLQVIKDPSASIQAYVEATLKLCSVVSGGGEGEGEGQGEAGDGGRCAGARMFEVLARRAAGRHAAQWTLANCMLVGLGLIKSESKSHRITWQLPGCYRVLADVITEPYFPPSLSETLRFFIRSKKESLASRNIDISNYPSLDI